MEQNENGLRDTRIEFTGNGREYFGIWIVNILLTIVTLGIYSAWAKVRTRKYFYNNTRIDGSVFDYHANPVAILKGWAIVVAVLLAYQVLFRINPLYGLGVLLFIVAFLPWAMVRSRVFNLLNTSYRNVRFHFDRDYKGMYAIFLTAPLPFIAGYGLLLYTVFSAQAAGVEPDGVMSGVSLLMIFGGLFLIPYFIARFYRYVMDHSAYGKTYFKSSFTAGEFYVLYLIAAGMFVILILMLVVIGLITAGVIGASAGEGDKAASGAAFMTIPWMLTYGFGLFFISSYVEVSKLNLIWGKTGLATHKFKSQLKPLGYMWVMLLNTLLIIVTFGIYVPWAKVRLIRYRLDNLVLQVDGELDHFAAKEREQVGALGAELGDAMDIAISL